MKRTILFLTWIALIGMMVALVGCGSRRKAEEPVVIEAQAQTVTAKVTEAVPDVPPPQPTATETVPASPLATPTPAPQQEARSPLQPAEDAAVPADVEPLVEKAKQMLAQMPQIQATAPEIRVQAVESREWPDSSLGCPQPGMMYAQMLTPGYLIVLRIGGETYEFHTNQRDQVVPCFKQPEVESGSTADGIPVELPAGATLVYQREGGFAGLAEQWVVYDDGRVIKDGDLIGQVAPQEVAQLVAQADQVGFFKMDAAYLPDNTCCDRFLHRLTIRNDDTTHTVSTVDSTPGAPPAIWMLIEQVMFLANRASGA